MSDATLERYIDQQIELGQKDPHEIATQLKIHLGDELVKITEPYIEAFISELARQKINAVRRASVAKITTNALADSEVLLKSLWVPSDHGEITYKAIGEMTAEDFDSRAAYLDRMALGIRTHAQWCRDCATKMRTENVKHARKLSSLPPLPELE